MHLVPPRGQKTEITFGRSFSSIWRRCIARLEMKKSEKLEIFENLEILEFENPMLKNEKSKAKWQIFQKL